jgi:hypothetical protein
VEAVAIDATDGLDHQIVGQARDRAGVRHVDRPRLAAVVVHRVHHVERQLQLVDAATGAGGVEDGRIRNGLLLVVEPVVGHVGEDVLRARRALGAQLLEDLVAEVVVAPVVGGDRLHRCRQPEHAP